MRRIWNKRAKIKAKQLAKDITGDRLPSREEMHRLIKAWRVSKITRSYRHPYR